MSHPSQAQLLCSWDLGQILCTDHRAVQTFPLPASLASSSIALIEFLSVPLMDQLSLTSGLTHAFSSSKKIPPVKPVLIVHHGSYCWERKGDAGRGEIRSECFISSFQTTLRPSIDPRWRWYLTLGVFIEKLGMEDFSARARVFLGESCDTSSSASLPGPQSLSVF